MRIRTHFTVLILIYAFVCMAAFFSDSGKGLAQINPDASNPDASNPDASDPDASNPDASDPDASDPDASDPNAFSESVWAELNAKAVEAYEKGNYAEGILAVEEAYQYALEKLGEEHPSTVASMNNLGVLLERQGRYEEAEPLFKETLRLDEKVLGEQHPDTLDSMDNLAELYSRQGRYKEMEPLYKEALRRREEALGEQHPDTLGSIDNLAELYSRQGRYKEVEPLYKEALRRREEALGEQHPDTLGSIGNLAGLYSIQGRYLEAEPLFKKALRLRQKVLGEQHPDTLGSVNNLAVLYESQGRYAEAEQLYKEVLQVRRKVLGEQHPDTLSSIDNIAGLYCRQGRYAEAEPFCKEALRLREKELGEQHPDTLASIDNLAGLYYVQGRYLEAEPLYKESLRLSEGVLGKQHLHTLIAIGNLAGLYSIQGRYAEAEPLCEEALRLSEKVLGKEHPNTLIALSNYIVQTINIGDRRKAFRMLKNMEGRMYSRSFQEMYRTSDDRVRRLYSTNISGFQDMVLSFANKYPETRHHCYAADVILRWKQVYFEEHAAKHRLLYFSEDPEIRRLREDLSSLRSEFGASILRKDGLAPRIGDIYLRLSQAEARLREKALMLNPDLQVSGASTERLLWKLPEKSALVEFGRYSSLDLQKREPISRNMAAYLLLSDVDAERQVIVKDLGPLDSISKNLEKSDDSANALYEMLFGKFEKQLEKVTTLYIAPDGILNILPFASLKTPGGDYLGRRFKIIQLQAGRDLLDRPLEKQQNFLVAVGGVDYERLPGNEQTDDLESDARRLPEQTPSNTGDSGEPDQVLSSPIPGMEEVETIEKLFTSNCKDGKVRVYKQREASETSLKNLETVPGILHLSTSGFFLQKASESPLGDMGTMALSGIALAGANADLDAVASETGDDGLLTSLEVLSLNLQGTELVSLSSCEIGKGATDYSDGMYALIRAFRTTGAQNVLMPLFKVEERDSRDFMVEFYQRWLTSPEGTPPAEALHQTRLHFMDHENPRYRDPSFWSPYVLVGGQY